MLGGIKYSNPRREFSRYERVINHGIEDVRKENMVISTLFNELGIVPPVSPVAAEHLKRLLTQAFVNILVLLFLSMGVVLVSMIFGLSLLLITAAVIQVYAYLVCTETADKSINVFALPYTTVITLVLAVFTFAVGLYNTFNGNMI